MTTLQQVELGVLGPLQVRQYGLPVAIPGAKPRAILTMLGLHGGSVVSADTLVELLWGDDPPRTAAKALQTHISSLRRTLGDGFVLTQGTGWTLSTTEIDATRYKVAARLGRDAIATGDAGQAVARFDEALTLWRGIPELPDGPRGVSEKTRWIETHAALVEDRDDALLATGRAAEIIGELEAAIADAPLRERRWGHLMLALYRAGRQGEALGAYQRARSLLAEELGVDPGPDLRRLEAAIVAQDAALEMPASQQLSSVTRAVTFLLTDIEGSTAAWEADADAMAVALARHDEIVEQVVTSRGGRLIKTRGEGDATFSVFDRPSAAAAAAIELQEAIRHEPWALAEPMRIRVALHTGEVELRDGDYFGRAVNRAARLRSLAAGGQILCSGATAELVIDTLPDDVVLADLGMRQLKNLARPEHVFELRLENADDLRAPTTDVPIERPGLPAVLAGPGPFVGRGPELERLLSAWQTTLADGTRAVLIAGEPGVGKTRLAGEWSRHVYEQGAVVLYGRCDEDLGAPYQPFAEALRSLVPCLGAKRLRGLRGVEALLPLVPGLTDALPDLAAPTRADPDTERYALFDAVVALLGVASASAPVVLILDDLHWAAKPTLLLLRHLLRFGEHARVQVVGTYRSTDLDRSHPLAAMLADLHRDGSASRLALSGLDEGDVTTYVAEAGYDDEELARALATVTGGNPFFLIEALRHVDESGGRWDPSTLPQGVREAVSRRLSRLPAETNKALAAAAVVGSHFALALVESVVGEDLIDAFDEASKAGIVIEEPGGRYRFNHAIVRQSLLAELASVRRMRLHQKIAATLETEPGADDELLAELAYHYFECAWAGNAAKAVEYCRRAADQAMARLAYEGAADLYDRAWHALEEIDDELPDRDDQQAELLVARCEALLAAGDVVSATGAVAQLQEAARDSGRLAAWGTCFDGQLSMLTDPERLDEIESAVSAAAETLAGLEDAAGEAKAHTVRAGCLARLGRIGDAETALDQALTAARRAREHRRVNAVLANAPLAALWGPNPVPRAGGRCLDVVRLLRITTGSPVVEATSTRCQGVLDAFRGRAAAGRQLIDSARRTLTELGMRHARLEVDQFAGIVELVADDPAAAEPHLRRAYVGFRRMGLDVDTAETAALLARACLALNRDVEADELCTESERLAGHALKASIAWRTVRAELSARSGAHDEARRVAEEAVAVAERTDLLVDHGDACLTLATVLSSARDTAGARAAANKAVELYELKGAAALAEKARSILGTEPATARAATATPTVEPDNACVRAIRRLETALGREAWDEVEQLFTSDVIVESRRKVVRWTLVDLPSGDWPRVLRRLVEMGDKVHSHAVVAVRGERLALTRLEVGSSDVSPGAPQDEALQLFALDEDGRIALHVFFDVEDMDAAVAELDAAHARFEERPTRASLENAASRADDRLNTLFADRRWDEIGELFADNVRLEDRRRGLRNESNDRATAVAAVRAIADIGTKSLTPDLLAIRGKRLALARTLHHGRDTRPDAFHTETLTMTEVNADGLIVDLVAFDPDDVDAAFEELDARYLAGEAAPYARVWQSAMATLGEANRHEPGPIMRGLTYVDHRRVSFGSGDFGRAVAELWALVPDARYRVTAVHALDAHGTVASLVIDGTDSRGNKLEWSRVVSLVPDEPRMDVYDDDDVNAALVHFGELRSQARKLENTASRVVEQYLAHFATRNWGVMAATLADDFSADDRRRVVNSGVRRGRNAEIANMQAIAELGCIAIPSAPIATRGERLLLARHSFTTIDWPEAFHNETIDVVEINADNQIVALITFDSDDLDAAITELDGRYLAGEAAPYAEIWQMIMDGADTLNRHEPGAMTQRIVAFADHRRIPFAAEDIGHATDKLWALVPDARYRAAAVHALDTHGAVINLVMEGTGAHGNELQWSSTDVITFVSGQVRLEVYDDDDVDAALVRFGELRSQPRKLENTASQVAERFLERFAAGDWDAIAEILADDFFSEDRRPVVGAGIRHGRDVEIASIRAGADLGGTNMTSPVIAIRGTRIILTRTHHSGRDQAPDAFRVDALAIVEIDADNRIAARIVFDPDDLDAAFEELDARYLAGEAAAHADVWSVITHAHAAFKRHELPTMTPNWVNLDHRRGAAFAPGEAIAYVRAGWDLDQVITTYIEEVHRLNELGAVFTWAGHGTSQEGFDAEWRGVNILTVEGDLINRCELFDENDLDAALARFDELSRPAPRLENAASQGAERFVAYFTARDWDALAELFADDYYCDDRRRVVNAGVRHGRGAAIEDLQVAGDVGLLTNVTLSVIATRGERLILTRWCASGRETDAAQVDVLQVIEYAEERFAAAVVFDLDDIEAAFEELDARYLAGEAAANAHTWSVIARAIAAFNRHELPEFMPDWVNVDHRRARWFAPGDLTAYIRATLDLAPDVNVYIEGLHQLSNLGAVFTQVTRGTSQDGFDAEWREIVLATIEGDLINRIEVFDETDLDAALARFDELSRATPRLENAASRVTERFMACFAARDWASMAELLAEDMSNDDRRRVVGVGVLHGRDTDIASMRAIADVGTKNVTSNVIATRGERLELSRVRFSGRDQRPEAFHAELLGIVEIDTDERIVARVAFDLDDIDAALEELDARYLDGEAAPYAQTWSLVTACYAAINRRELPPTTPDFIDVDHRRATAMAPGDLVDFVRAAWNQIPDISFRVEAVHRLSSRGAVVTQAMHGTSQEGFEAEWREIHLMTVEGDQFNRSEFFEEADLDAALARFEELNRPAPRLKNAASQVYQRFWGHYAARDWASIAELLADDISTDDRRRVVNAGIQYGRDAQIADMRSLAEIGADMTWTVMATRGQRLVLSRVRTSNRDLQHGEFDAEMLGILEIDADNRIAAFVTLELDDIDAAFEELDARYVTSEAAPYAHTWSVVTQTYAALNRREQPATTPDWINIDHRRVTAFAPGELTSWIRASWDIAPDINIHIEAAHRLTNCGAVVTHTANATSQEGFNAEWRVVTLLTVEGELINRVELYDEEDLDAALARFDEVSRPAPRLENAASKVDDRFEIAFAARDFDAMAEMMADDIRVDDRRPAVNAGLRRGRDAEIANMRAIAELGVREVTSSVIAIRGDRLALSRNRFSGRDKRPEAFRSEAVCIIEIDNDARIVARVSFDPDDIDAAFEELDARYLASEAAPHSQTWSVIARNNAAFNRHEFPSTTPDWVTIDHRRVTSFEPGDMTPYIRATWDVAPDATVNIETVHRVSNLGAVVTQVSKGTSQEGFDAEWRVIALLTVDGDLINRCELFEDADIDAALARFGELSAPTPPFENAATRARVQIADTLNRGDLHGCLALINADGRYEDRRKGLRDDAVGQGLKKVADALFEVTKSWLLEIEPVAIRGSRLGLTRDTYRDTTDSDRVITAEHLTVTEVDDDDLVCNSVLFDPDDIDAAFEELDARYLAGDAAAHAHTWSVIARTYATFNRHELPPATPDTVDHRRLSLVESGDLTTSLGPTWDLMPDGRVYIEAVHRLGNLGAVVTHVAQGTAQQGFNAEWRAIDVLTVERDLINRCELFDEADLDAALARFDELHPQTTRVENAASRAVERYLAHFARREWDALAETLADDISLDDRRRVVGAGLRHGRHAEVAALQAGADSGLTNISADVVATRGERLALTRSRVSGRDQGPEAFHVEMLGVAEINADERIVARVMFDTDDIDAAFAELDARYLAGEAAAYSRTWSLIAAAYAALDRHELPATTPDWVNIDHRRGTAFARGDMTAFIRTAWDVAPDITIYIEAVHRLSDLGAVVTHAVRGTSQAGFDAEWRVVALLTVDGDLINRCELFDEADLDAALARFDELSRPAPRLENAASRVYRSLLAYFGGGKWDAITKMLAEDLHNDDRRRVVSAGVQHGRDATIASMRATADLADSNIIVSSTVIATRGERLALSRDRFSIRDEKPDAFLAEVLGIVEIDAHQRIVARVALDDDAIDAAFEELDARYLAGEAADHAHTWSVIARTYAEFNRHGLVPEPDWVSVDHRRGSLFASSDLDATIRASRELTPDLRIYIESVHRLSDLGAVVTNTSVGTAHEGFAAEWRMIQLLTVEGDRIGRLEMFDEVDIDAALARFDELNPSSPRLENAASRVGERFSAYMAAPDWAAMADMVAEEMCNDDRRPVVNAGLRRGRDAEIANVRTLVDLGVKNTTPVVIATRGERLALGRIRLSGRDQRPEAFHTEVLGLIEIDAENRISARVWFELDDIDAAFEELDARYVAGEAAAHGRTWSLIASAYAALNRHVLPPATPDWVNIDRRRLAMIEAGDLTASIRAAWDLAPESGIYIETVHRLSKLGAVLTWAGHGTSQEGFEAESRGISILTVKGNLINRCELFDEADLDAALAKFDELSAPTLANAATRARAHMADAFNRRNLDGFLAGYSTAEARYEDRRKGLRDDAAGPGLTKRARALFEAPMRWRTEMEPVAIRGPRLALTRDRYRDTDSDRTITAEHLTLTEVGDDNLVHRTVLFDPDDINGAIGELTARWIASGAVAHPHVIEAVCRLIETVNSHDWDAFATLSAGATYVNHRQLSSPGVETIADHMPSIRTMAALVPDYWVELAEVLTYSPIGVVGDVVLRGASTDGLAIEIPLVMLLVVDRDRVTGFEAFDPDRRDLAMARFEELNQPT